MPFSLCQKEIGQPDFRFLITGSGRLDLYKKGGDSLLGRYFSVPLLPLTLGVSSPP